MSSQSGGEYKFNFQDLTRLVNDVRYLFKTGGNVFQAGGTIDLLGIRNNLTTIILLGVLIYVIYYLLFKGYPRMITNVATFSFFHKENMDSFLKRDDLLIKTFKALSTKAGYDLFDFLYKTSAGSNLYNAMVSLKKAIVKNYEGLKPEAQFYESIREYFLFQNRYQNTALDIQTPKEKLLVKNKEFYEQLLGYYLTAGLYNAKGKGDDQQLIDVYRMDEKNGFKVYNRAYACKGAFDNVSKAVSDVIPLLLTPYLAYIVLPENKNDFTAVSVDLEKLGPLVSKPEVYKKPIDQVNPFSWYVIEALQYRSNPALYNRFASEIGSIPFDSSKRTAIVKYLNLSPQKRKLAETRVFKKSLPVEFYRFVNKRPIFSHVYFSNEVGDKAGLYSRVMQAQLRFYKETNGKFNHAAYLNGLSTVKDTKMLVAYMHCMNLYINVYREKIINTYQDQNYANKFFFSKLFNPYMDDFVKNRMLRKIKETFSFKSWKECYEQFRGLWIKLGKILKDLVNDLPDKFGGDDD